MNRTLIDRLAKEARRMSLPENYFRGIETRGGLWIPTNVILFGQSHASLGPIIPGKRDRHHRHILMVMLQGRTRVVLDAHRSHPLEPGMVLWVRPHQLHAYYDFSAKYQMLFITFELPDVVPPSGPNPRAAMSPDMERHLQSLMHAYAQKTRMPPKIALYLGLLLQELVEANGSHPRPRAIPAHMTWMDALTARIMARLDRPLTAEFLASEMNLSAGHLRKRFRSYGLGSLGAYIRNARFEMAESLLASSDLSIKEVRERCGFKSAPTFAREFQRRNHCSPSQFHRRSEAGQVPPTPTSDTRGP